MSTAAARTTAPRGDPWMLSCLGNRITLTDPTATKIDIREIAAGLSRICRWGGQLRIDEFYSVASHSVMVSRLLPSRLALAGLLHDASEAYMGADITSPLKSLCPELKALENRWHKRIQRRFGVRLQPGDATLIHRADMVARLTEARDLMHPYETPAAMWCAPDTVGVRASGTLQARSSLPGEARREFLVVAYSLGVLPEGGI